MKLPPFSVLIFFLCRLLLTFNIVCTQTLSNTSKPQTSNSTKLWNSNWRDYRNRLNKISTTNYTRKVAASVEKQPSLVTKAKQSKKLEILNYRVNSNKQNNSSETTKNETNLSQKDILVKKTTVKAKYSADSLEGTPGNQNTSESSDVTSDHVKEAENATSIPILSPPITVTPEEDENSIIKFGKSLVNRIDRYTLIMTCAFLIGLLMIVMVIAFAVCICKSLNKFKRSRHRGRKDQELTNPAYDFLHIKNSDSTTAEPDFLLGHSSPVTNEKNDKLKIYNNSNKQDFTTPVSKYSSLDEKKALLGAETIELATLNSVAETTPKTRHHNIKDPNQSLTSRSSSASSSVSSIDSIIGKTPKSILMSSKLNKKSPLTPPQSKNSAYAHADLSTPITTKSGNVFTNLAQKLSGSKSQLKMTTPENEPTRFTPAMRDKTKQQMSKEVHMMSNSRRSLVLLNKRRQSESGGDADLPYFHPTGSSQRASVISSTSSIINIQNKSIDFSMVKTGVDDLLQDMTTNPASSSNASMNKSQHSLNKSVSNIYMDAIREKRQKIEEERLAKLNKSNVITADTGISINLNPAGAGTVAKANLVGGGSKLYETGSVNTLESEKSCY